MPRNQLLVLGASVLVAQLLGALALVALLLGLYSRVASARGRLGLLVLLLAGATLYYLLRADPSLDLGLERRLLVTALLVAAGGLALAYRQGEQALAQRREGTAGGGLSGFGLTVFITAALFTAIWIFMAVVSHPKISSAAVVVSGSRAPVFGVYVGETGGPGGTQPARLYIGRVSPSRSTSEEGVASTGALIGIPQSAVVALAVGPAEPLSQALARGPQLAARAKQLASRGGSSKR